MRDRALEHRLWDIPSPAETCGGAVCGTAETRSRTASSTPRGRSGSIFISRHIFSIETTIKCPARCTMCPRPAVIQSRHNKVMPEWMVAKVLDEIDWPCFINWEWINEPLCDDRIYGFMAQAKAKGVRNWITTTGYLLSDERARRLLHSGVDVVVFSIDSLDAPLYEQIRKLPLDRVMENVKAFMAYKERTGSRVDVWVSKIQLPVTRHESRDEFRRVFTEMGSRTCSFQPIA